MKRLDLHGFECDWFAVDDDGHLALCSSAGFGPIPNDALASITATSRPDDVAAELLALPEIGSAELEGRGPGWCAEWPALSRRGFFVYDWRHWQGPYERIVRPSKPILQSALPGEILSRMALVPLEGCLFTQLASFHVHLLVPCDNADDSPPL